MYAGAVAALPYQLGAEALEASGGACDPPAAALAAARYEVQPAFELLGRIERHVYA